MNFNMKSSIAVKLLLGAASVLALSSCQDFLTADPVNKISAENFFRTESDLEIYSNGLIEEYRPSGETAGNFRNDGLHLHPFPHGDRTGQLRNSSRRSDRGVRRERHST